MILSKIFVPNANSLSAMPSCTENNIVLKHPNTPWTK